MAARKFEWLEAMRGGAACWVVVHHADLAVGAFIGEVPRYPPLQNGHLGVDFFFVLSGFIIAHSSRQLKMRGGGLSDYVRARFVRIYVPYLPIGIGMLIAYQLLPGLSSGNRAPGVFTSITLLPSPSPPALSPAWTLVHEVLFYFLYSLYFLFPKALIPALCVWLFTIIGFHFASGFQEVGRTGLSYLISTRNLAFLVGVCVFALRQQAARPPMEWLGLLLGGLLGLVVALQPVPDHLLAVIAFALLVWVGAGPLAATVRVPRLAVTLGGASYSIYLVHNPMLSLAARVARWAGMTNGWAALPVFVCIAVLAGTAYSRWIEQPSLRWVGEALVRLRTGPPSKQTGASGGPP